MKELVQINPDNIPAIVKQIEKQQLIKSLPLRPGHRCFEFNLNTGKISLAEINSSNIDFSSANLGTPSARHKVISKPGCIYETALNVKSVQKKFFKSIKEAIQTS